MDIISFVMDNIISITIIVVLIYNLIPESKDETNQLPQDELIYKVKYLKLLKEYNSLISLINSKGGEAFLKGESSQFTQSEIKTLISLCHPDRHNGIKESHDITSKLLLLRRKKHDRKIHNING